MRSGASVLSGSPPPLEERERNEREEPRCDCAYIHSAVLLPAVGSGRDTFPRRVPPLPWQDISLTKIDWDANCVVRPIAVAWPDLIGFC